MIQVEKLSKRYGKETVIDELSVTFQASSIYGLVGPNGCGKTTLMRCICGFCRPTSGKIIVDEKEIGRDVDFPPQTGIIIESPGFLPHYSGLQNLKILASISGRVDRQRAADVMRQVGLDPSEKKHVGKYSLGMRQRLGIAQAIMEDPEILILDEPFNGLDKTGMTDIRALFQKLKSKGKLIILVSHYAQEIADNCDIVLELENGKIKQQHSQHEARAV